MICRKRFFPLVAGLLNGFSALTLANCASAGVQSPSAAFLCAHPEAIHEQYRIMLGRKASKEEVQHVARTLAAGYQWAYFEPYPTYPPVNHHFEFKTCTNWVGTTDDPAHAGIPYQEQTGPGGVPEKTEWSGRGSNAGQIVGALYRTYFCKLPSASELKPYVRMYRKNMADPKLAFDESGAHAVAVAMSAKMKEQGSAPCWDAIADVTDRVLGRAPVTDGCDYAAETAPSVTTPEGDIPGSVSSCYWLWHLANGKIAPNDLAHGIRTTQEALLRNENPDCYAQYPVSGQYNVQFKPFRMVPLADDGSPVPSQFDPHAVGEYVSLLYRVFLARQPSPDELAADLAAYSSEGGDPQEFLKGIADRMTNPDNQKNRALLYPQYAVRGGFPEYQNACGHAQLFVP